MADRSFLHPLRKLLCRLYQTYPGCCESPAAANSATDEDLSESPGHHGHRTNHYSFGHHSHHSYGHLDHHYSGHYWYHQRSYVTHSRKNCASGVASVCVDVLATFLLVVESMNFEVDAILLVACYFLYIIGVLAGIDGIRHDKHTGWAWIGLIFGIFGLGTMIYLGITHP